MRSFNSRRGEFSSDNPSNWVSETYLYSHVAPTHQRKIGGSRSRRPVPCVLYTTWVSSVLIKGSANLLSFLTTRHDTDARVFIYVVCNPQPKAGVLSVPFSNTLNLNTKAILDLVSHFLSPALTHNFHALLLTSACRLVVHGQRSWGRRQPHVFCRLIIVAPSQTGSSAYFCADMLSQTYS